ncbi:hypothetical protein GETHPA_28390 [Geothrix rubra]|uniref:DUF3606 domain-containing protein n=1 Tax=Geothrix rubra TaxID=2927977 RepID=A0ABQ5QAC5_9BACT|nr:DUF3606 domain-containing protein [Geothrix rubra]GLH71306.1 hypothetical protein GETHPA_28390 [Geothrix rubra]
MPDELMSHEADGQELVHVDQIHDLRDWAIYFSVSKEKLKAAVAAVGPRVEDVRRYLGK